MYKSIPTKLPDPARGLGLGAEMKKYICKHCKVQVISSTDFRAIVGHEHSRKCPRRFRHFHPNTRTKK